MLIEGLDDFVFLEPVSHKYYDKEGAEYLSVSKFISLYAEEFDRETISKMSAKKRGLTQAQVLAEWDGKRDRSIHHGNRIHNCLELFEKTTLIEKGNEDLRPLCIDLATYFKPYWRQVPEAILYDKETKIAGTTDKILQLTSHKASRIDFADYKTNLEKGIYYVSEHGKYLKGPLSHLSDCNYNRYALQLSIYAYLYQKKTGRKIGRLSIIYIPPTDFLKWQPIPVPYMKKEVEAMFEDYYNRKFERQMTNSLPEVIKQYPVAQKDCIFDEDDF